MIRTPVMILCGGRGLRLHEETEFRPKPLAMVGNRPILWHIMRIYAHFRVRDFVLCLGYKGEMIKDYFVNYRWRNSDLTMDIGRDQVRFHTPNTEHGWKVTLADTGVNTMTGARIVRAGKYIPGKTFMMTYGDGVADVDVASLLRFHRSHGKIATVTGVRPPSRFGELQMDGERAVVFSEKPQVSRGFINGGFFVFNREIFRYLDDDESCTFEREPMERLANDGQLMVYRHTGYWQCMDTMRDLQGLNDIWASGKAPWKIW